MFWAIGLVLILLYVMSVFDSNSRESEMMMARQFFKDEYRLEWKEENDPLLRELKMDMMRIY